MSTLTDVLVTQLSLGVEGQTPSAHALPASKTFHLMGYSQMDALACFSVAEVVWLTQRGSVYCHKSVRRVPSSHIVYIYVGLSFPWLKTQGAFMM